MRHMYSSKSHATVFGIWMGDMAPGIVIENKWRNKAAEFSLRFALDVVHLGFDCIS